MKSSPLASGLRVVVAGACLLALNAVSSAQSAYMISRNGKFGTVDLSSGAFISIGTTPITLAGLAESGGKLYGAAYGSSTFYQVDPATGNLTTIGTSSMTFFGLDSTDSGIFGYDTSSNLYSINPGSGASTLIGNMGIGFGGFEADCCGGSTLYLSAQNQQLYSVNTSNAHSTFIGNTGTAGGVGAMVSINNTLYAGVENPLSVYTINTTTGAGTFVTNLSNFSNDQIYGLAPLLTVPEPATMAVLGLGGLALLRRRRPIR